ncbi:MAG: glycosyltransferase [Terriglobales bacterium]
MPSSLAAAFALEQAPAARIGLVNKFWGRDRGGVEAVLHAEACDLGHRGYRVSVLACRRAGTAPQPFPAGVAGRELIAPVVASMPVQPQFFSALRELALSSDLLHFHLPFPLAEAAALRLTKRTPWIATLHAEVCNHPAWMRSLQRRLTRRFLQRMDAIVISSAPSAHCATLAPFRNRLRIIPFGFDLRPFLALGERRRPARTPVVAFLGRLVPYKGLDVLLRAAPGVPAEFHILGDGRERSRLERLAAHLGVSWRVRFFGHVPDAALPHHLHQADVFVLPSRLPAEAFGVAQVEAMATGLPVINTALATGTDWVSPHGLTGLTVPPGDVAALHQALQVMLGDRGFRLACGERARQRARDLFGIERRGQELAALLDELLPVRARAAS